MAIKVVDASNFAEFVAENTPDENGQMPVMTSGGESTLVDPASVIKDGGNSKSTATTTTVDGKPVDDSTKPANGLQERINELTRLRKEADEFAEGEYNARIRSDKQIEALTAEIAELKAAIPKPTDAEEGKPDATKYKEGEEQKYIEDLAKWTADRAVKADRAEQERIRNEAANAAALQEAQDAYNARAATFAKATPDFKEAIDAVGEDPIRPWIRQAVLESENGPALAYHLAKNPDVRVSLNKLSAVNSLRELGRLEGRLVDAVVKLDSQRRTTNDDVTPISRSRNLPAPITPVQGGESTVDRDPRQPMPYAEYRAMRKAGRIK